MSAPDVALISPYPPSGVRHGGASGVASYTANLAHAIAAEGGSVTVVAAQEDREQTVASDGPVRVERRFRRGARAVPAAIRAARRTGARAVHLQHEVFLYGGATSVPGLVAGLADLRRSPSGGVVTMHHVVDGDTVDDDFARMHRVAAPQPVVRAGLATVRASIARLADRVIVHEPAFAGTIPDADVVPHGVETGARPSRVAARERLGLDRFTALCFGFLAPYKGLETALDAARLLGDGAELVVAGGEHPRLRDAGDGYAADLRANNPHARFTGYVPDGDVADWFAAADLALYLYPRPVSSSGALALALAHGTPFLLSAEMAATAGAPELLTAPGDPAALAQRIRDLATSPSEREALSDTARALGRDRAWPVVARRHLEIYEEVSHAHRASGRGLRPA
jgi:glycosyltransferase involved in cell wall biosynthesis